MFLAPNVATKSISRIQSGEAMKALSGYLRRDALNATQKAEKVASSAVEYFSPCTPLGAETPKNCAKIIDFKF